MDATRRDDILRLLLHAYPDRVCVRRANDPSRGVMVGGRGVVLEPSSTCREGRLFLALDPRDAQRDGRSEARVSLASRIEEPWLAQVHPHLVERRTAHRFDPERGRVITTAQTLYAGLVIREDIAGAAGDPEGASTALAEWIAANAEEVLAKDEEATRLLRRLAFVRRHVPEAEVPALDGPEAAPLLAAACAGCTTLEQVTRRGLAEVLRGALPYEARAALDECAPESVEVPSGSRIRIDYPGDGPPVLAVRLQEVFGLAETPRLARGRVPVVMHLLAPNYRPAQVTQDLRSFWANTYAEVRKELRARYPRHPWPEDPWSAQAVAVGRRRQG
jgi:ATP-dependent helicase HrpB